MFPSPRNSSPLSRSPEAPASAKIRQDSSVFARDRAASGSEQEKRERINSILETARARRIAMTGSGEGENGEDGNGTGMGESPRSGSLRGLQMVGGNGETESSADEETSFVRRERERGRHMDYQGTRLRKEVKGKPSTASIRRAGVVYDGTGGGGREGSDIHSEDTDEQEGWWARMLSEYGSIELENKGSVARDHLALERTFLAWLRTSLAFASIGIAITQLFRLNVTSAGSGDTDPYKHLRQMGKPLGATFLGISIVILFIGFHRYFESQHWIIRGKFPASRGSVTLVAAITFALMITSLVVVIIVEPKAYEK